MLALGTLLAHLQRYTAVPPMTMFGQSVRGQPLHIGTESLLSLFKTFPLAMFPSLSCIILCTMLKPLFL